MRLLFYSRPWTSEMHLALDRHWRDAGMDLTVCYVTQHVEVVSQLRRAGRDATFLPREAAAIDVSDAYGVLESFERRYGAHLLPLTRYVMSERYFLRRGGAWQLEQLARYLLAWQGLFEELSPDLLVSAGHDIMPGWLAHELAPLWGCEPVGLSSAPIPSGRLIIRRGHDEIRGLVELHETISSRPLTEAESRSAEALQRIVLGEGTRPDFVPYGRNYSDLLRRMLTGSVLRHHVAHSSWQWRERLAGNYYQQKDQFVHRATQPFRAARWRLAETRLLTRPLPARPYVFYPLHMEPEAALLVHGSYFEDQVTVMRNLARSLPAGWELVVKEHPAMRGYRPLRYYRRLWTIPKLRLIPASIRSNVVLRGSQVVATISGTAGLEAALVGKPVILFGDTPWAFAPTVHRVGALTELPDLIRGASANPLGSDDPQVRAFAAAWDAALPPGRYHKHREYDWLAPDNVRQIACAIESVVPGAFTRTRGEAEAREAVL